MVGTSVAGCRVVVSLWHIVAVLVTLWMVVVVVGDGGGSRCGHLFAWQSCCDVVGSGQVGGSGL